VQADGRILALLSFGKEVYAMSEGRTNICLGAVLSLWHTARETKTLPEQAALQAAAVHTSIDALVLDTEKKTVAFTDEKLRLDVGAIAKGYATREVCKYAEENLWRAATVSIGGNVCSFGYKNDDGSTLWNIQIENPDETAAEALETLHLANRSVVTSGDYQRYFEVDGKRYCHIINPDTLYPSEYMTSVTVICADAALADALSTTLFNMRIEDGVELIKKTDGVEAVWVDKEYRKTYSDGFTAYL